MQAPPLLAALLRNGSTSLVEKLQRAHAAENSSGQFTVIVASPWEITLTRAGECYHIDKNCWGTQKARSKKKLPPLQSFCKESEVNWCALPEVRSVNVSCGSRYVS